MGQPRKSRKKYNTPPHPWNAERIKNENKVCPYRIRKNQKKTRFQKSYFDKEDEKTKKKFGKLIL